MAQFIANIVKNTARGFLQNHLSRERPDTHKGEKFLIPERGGQGEEEFAAAGEVRMCRPLPPRYDPELARLLRCLCMAWQRAARNGGARCVLILQGSTLHSWFHVGSQLPWKTDIHLAVVLVSPEPPAPRPSGSARQLNQPRGLPSREIADEAERVFHSMVGIVRATEQPGGAEDAARRWTVKGERPGRPAIHIYSYPRRGAALDPNLPVRRVSIDGGNTATHVPWPKAEIIRQLRQWHAERCRADSNARARNVLAKRGGASGGAGEEAGEGQGAAAAAAATKRKKVSIGKALRSVPTVLSNRLDEVRDKHGADAAARLHMPSGWSYCAERKAFYIPNRIEAAFSWPPSFTTLSTAIYALLLLGLLYAVCTSVLPSLAYSLDRKAALTAMKRKPAVPVGKAAAFGPASAAPPNSG
jgi:hypothetical protein